MSHAWTAYTYVNERAKTAWLLMLMRHDREHIFPDSGVARERIK